MLLPGPCGNLGGGVSDGREGAFLLLAGVVGAEDDSSASRFLAALAKC